MYLAQRVHLLYLTLPLKQYIQCTVMLALTLKCKHVISDTFIFILMVRIKLFKMHLIISSSLRSIGRAENNGRSMDNVRSKIGFVRSNPSMAGQFVQLFMLVRKKLRVSSFKYLKVQCYYFRCLSGQKWGMSKQK